ncbi:CcoQ/FixQ family Cbb3-type cytochrome c oxidase assembly chaperone [Photobacterium swingsii]|uniref:CcoQ/FixQ family Cbb3-type cytochrome c oxidase assembly chaperone n=2 Tax=Photobacterium TaxID=657 RepID=A0AAW7Y625_9GAMM|nr:MULTISPECIES: CcoQ/FixQ family Cbb3-type cytochrome c oxidase assembly chaperone [Photobacterium]KMV31032.1 cytochrome C oxidase [Photobacterium swingsii]KXI22667.1 cytochrome C oxidase [Photobacterium sanguinicancri]MDO6496822.1 CcoQ/FixQ family Cbb3-type cytochrome c oxidase assembly chaperone [Photobacterium sanguinicancri]MDO6543465.1 CcoQ/FixQ family Cbb3-type cytochrome c oxidase assembly chaperone [Photobacterium sanguinicancri]OZS43445.1 CcoQ/FixQ family Cbb3-type cytochrome c oxida
MDIGTVHSIWTVILFSSFIGIVVWAFSKRQKARFDEAANLVFADEEKDVATRDKDRS